MAGKLQNNASKFRKIGAASNQEIKTAQEVKTKSIDEYISESKKEKQYVSIELIDPAPSEWNFFPPLEPAMKMQLKISIMNTGIMVPVILWKQPTGRYMTLSGHNRVTSSREILVEYKDKDQEHRFDYSKIPAIVYEFEELSEAKAQEIIIDTNYIQRGNMSPQLRVKIIKARLNITKSQTDEHGSSIDQMIENLRLKKSAIYDDIKIGTQVISPIQDLYFAGTISRKAALKFSLYDDSLQTWIHDSFPDKMTNKYILRLSKNIRVKEQIKAIFTDAKEPEGSERVQLTVSQKYISDVKKISNAYCSDPGFRKYVTEYFKKNS